MSQLNVGTIKDQNGSGQPDLVGVAKAFVNFNGMGTVAIRSGFNVISITDNGTGDYTALFENDMPDADYAVSGFSQRKQSTVSYTCVSAAAGQVSTAESVRLIVLDLATAGVHTSGIDAEVVCITIHSI